MSQLQLVDACHETHFAHMSLLHALGWRTAYRGCVPADYMAREITDGRWVPFFRKIHKVGRYHGLVLYDGDRPLCCGVYGPARTDGGQPEQAVCVLSSPGLEQWGEIISLYTHPEERGKGYGSLLMEEMLRRLSGEGRAACLVYVLRENHGARRFYARHGFSWDGASVDVSLQPDTVLTDLRYIRQP